MGLGYSPAGADLTCVDSAIVCVQSAIDRLTSTMDFWSIHDACVTIDCCETTIALPAVVVADLPACIVVSRANIMVKWRLTVNINACCSNNLIGCYPYSPNTITVALTGGTDCDFDVSDAYTITSQDACYRANSIRRVRIATNLEIYLNWDSEANACCHRVHLLAGEAYNDDGLRIASRISFINVVCCETPVEGTQQSKSVRLVTKSPEPDDDEDEDENKEEV